MSLKMHAWRSWREWSEVFDLIFFDESSLRVMNEDANGILEKESTKLKEALQKI